MGLRFPLMVLSLVAMLGFSPRLAGAKPPSAADSSVPCGINLVGTTAGVADARGEFTIVARDIAHNPLPGTAVAIDFSGCTPDIRLCSVQSAAGTAVDCTGNVIHAVTDGNGQVTLRILGGANNATGGAPGAGFECARVSADGIWLAFVNVGAVDQDGAGGVNPADVSLWLSDAFAFPATYVGRSDFDCSHTIDPADLSLLIQASLGGGSSQSCPQYCR